MYLHDLVSAAVFAALAFLVFWAARRATRPIPALVVPSAEDRAAAVLLRLCGSLLVALLCVSLWRAAQ